jgi:hypothetical protein
MQAYEFFARPENGSILIPEPYRDMIKREIKVIILDEWSEKSEAVTSSAERKTDLLLSPSLDTQGWTFNKDEANER